ncbi:type II toxin-antitoxin system RelE/ParE family toxin [Brucella sp. IR073]|uniref:type II toxin-antitoxin system RelE/ParE family toxin n=1 Tax=unclassified Brucella TaxID=2632610 RepID=UPI003B98743B
MQNTKRDEGAFLTPAARADLRHIWRHSAKQWSIGQADRYVKSIRAACLDLASGQKPGQRANAPGYMKCVVGSHIIYYRIQDASIVVVRILHGMMDANKHLH